MTLPCGALDEASYATEFRLVDGYDEGHVHGERLWYHGEAVADCFKYRNKIGLDVALEALRETWRARQATMDDLWEYARVCRVANVMRPYMESLTWPRSRPTSRRR